MRSVRFLWVLGVVLMCASCRAPAPTPPTSRSAALGRFEYTRAQMGVPFRIVLYARDLPSAAKAADAAYRRIAQLNAIMSDYEDDSELTLLSKTSGSGRWVPVSPDLWRVLERAQSVARSSEGAFDVTVGPMVQLWRRARRQREMPDPARLAAARQASGWRNLELDPRHHQVRLLVPNMRLDLGAIAKGFAADEALKVIRRMGIRSALVAGSGDMAFGDPPPGRAGWRVEVAPLDVPDAPPSRFVLLSNCGVATSGDVFQHVEIGGVRYSHIVDPRTGVGLTDHSLVTVIAPDCMAADSLSTTVSVMGPGRGFGLVERTRGASAHEVRMLDGRVQASETRGFRKHEDLSARKES